MTNCNESLVGRTVSFRVAAKTEPGEFRTITMAVTGEGEAEISCDCGNDFCAHIDATLVVGERAMVPPEDRAKADLIMNMSKGQIIPPKDWKRSWWRDYKWRDVVGTRQVNHPPGWKPAPMAGSTGKPVVCFTGQGPKQRRELVGEAKASGWDTTNNPTAQIKVLVAEDPNGNSRKLEFAREFGIPIITYDEWQLLTVHGESKVA